MCCRSARRRTGGLFCWIYASRFYIAAVLSVASPEANLCFVLSLAYVDDQTAPVPEPGPVYAGAGPSDHYRASDRRGRSQAL